MAKNLWSLVYGGGSVGLMGVLAENVVALQGPDAVHGITARALLQGGSTPPPDRFGRTTVVDSMRERKRMMTAEADAFVALPDGVGTLEEMLEMASWSQLGIHARPVLVLNTFGFFDEWMRTVIRFVFMPETQVGLIGHARTVEKLVKPVAISEPVPGRYTFLNWSLEENLGEGK